MIFATTASLIEGYQIVAYKGTAQGATFEALLHNTEAMGANAVLNICYDNAISPDTVFHGSAFVIEPKEWAHEMNSKPKNNDQGLSILGGNNERS